MTRVAFTLIGGKSWTGGYNYLLNLFKVVTQRCAGAVRPVLFVGDDVDRQEVAPFAEISGVDVVRSPVLNASHRAAALINSVALGYDPAQRRLLREYGIDVVFEAAQFFGARLGIPAIAWIPDFQHRALPQLFPRVAWWKRELGFRMQIAAGRTVMLSSADARRSCESFYPSTAGRTHVVRFAVPAGTKPSAAQVQGVREHYGLPARYVFMPNQFWLHKNHLLVVDALTELRRTGHCVVVVASGKPLDPRHPSHYKNLRARITDAGLKDDFRLLGLIPYEHLAVLMTGSVAVLNPSLFEGWSTTVEEARALNVPLVLSDLPVHLEQASGMARFFDRHDANALASALLSIWREDPVPGADADCARPSRGDPVQRFADDFVELIKRVAGPHAAPPIVAA